MRSLVAALAVASWAGAAGADEGLRVSIQWARLADALHNGGLLRSQEAWFPASGGRAHFLPTDRLVGWHLSPQLSVVARDWSGAQPIVGNLALTDRMRLSRSSRMVISRLRFTDGGVVPFAQAGIGQWRVDTDLMPVLPPDTEPAGALGAGLEFCVDQSAVLGVETDYTILYRQQHEPQMISGPHLWGTYFAARIGF